jgi:hypothetical protein
MSRSNRRWWAAVALAVGLVLPAQARAGSLLGLWHRDCPPSSYSPCHYWTPALYRVCAAVHGPKLGVYPPDRFPSVPPNYLIIRYPCPAAEPGSWPYGTGACPCH